MSFDLIYIFKGSFWVAVWRIDYSSSLCELQLSIFTVLEIKIEKNLNHKNIQTCTPLAVGTIDTTTHHIDSGKLHCAP